MYNKVLSFWLGEVRPCVQNRFSVWYAKNEAFDQEIIKEFGEIHSQLIINPRAIGDEPDQLLASIIVLDQFSRNMFRNDPKSFAYDSLALELTKSLHPIIQNGSIPSFGMYEKMFTYMPLMHSETWSDHELGLQVFDSLAIGITITIIIIIYNHETILEYPEGMAGVKKYMIQHGNSIEIS